MSYHATRAEEQKYYRALRRLFSGMVKSLQDKPVTTEAVQSAVDALQHSVWFERAVLAAVRAMVTGRVVSGARTWKEAAQQGMRGREIYEAIQKEMQGNVGLVMQWIVRDNAKLIKTLPTNLARLSSEYAMKCTMQGLRPEEVERRLRAAIPREIKNSLKTIARTECSKAATALTEARCQDVGISWYVWRTSQDSRVRSSHDIMNGVLVSWRDPPSPELLAGEKSAGRYHAGCIYNCRCIAMPLISLETLPASVKVYSGGAIRTMSRSAFGKWAGIGKA